ncbi:MAG: hypothetical protein GTO22_06740 [Gemmatimonadales bacterium]|nr:hypothetical protein [Gemmatimonadales bacterium]
MQNDTHEYRITLDELESWSGIEVLGEEPKAQATAVNGLLLFGIAERLERIVWILEKINKNYVAWCNSQI